MLTFSLGLIMHPRNDSTEGGPHYSLVRLSATGNKQDWYQTNLPDTGTRAPQWAGTIRKLTTRLVPRAVALQGLDSDTDDSDEDLMEDDDSKVQVHHSRFRIWGMAASPGGGSTAVLVSQFNTQHPERRAVSKLMFGWRERGREDGVQVLVETAGLTTEGRLWECMYGGAAGVSRTATGSESSRATTTEADESRLRLRQQFRHVAAHQRCVFCDAELQAQGNEVKCANGHTFARCASTGLAIMGPDISRICAVCELRCLKVSELVRIAEEHDGPGTTVESSGEACGGCGGKFVA